MTSNPITAWISDHMVPYANREAEMKDRLAEASINAQKRVDERNQPFRANYWWQKNHELRDFNHFYLSSSSYKGKEMGNVNSFKAHRYYSQEAAERRDALLKEIQAEEQAAAATTE